MKKIVFLILFLTGVFPVFNNDGLYLASYNSYGQGELDEVEIVKCTGITTTIDYETDQFIDYLDCEEEYDYDLKECVAGTNCIIRTEYKEPEDDDEDEDCPGMTCPSGFELTDLCNCEEVVQPCPNDCGEGFYQTLDCGCEPVPPPSCTKTCGTGYKLVNCNCIPCPTSCPIGFSKINCNCVYIPPLQDPCDQAATAAGVSANNIINNTNVQNALANLPAFTNSPSQVEYGFTIKKINGTTVTTPMDSGTSTGIILTGYTINSIADVHTHPGGAYAPSATDLFHLNHMRSQTTAFTTSFIKSSDGNIYALYINDSTKLSNFVSNNPGFVASNNNFNPQTVIGKLFWDTNNDLMQAGYTSQEAYTRATAFVLQDAGVTLLKSNATTINFKKIDLREDIPAIGPNGIPVYSIIDCN